MQITRTVVVAARADDLWAIAGEGFAAIDRWASTVTRSEPRGHAPDLGTPVEGRTCTVAMPGSDRFEERIVAFDPAAHTLTYEVISGLPDFVDRVVSTWAFEAVDPTTTQVSMTTDLTTRGFFGALARPILALHTRRTLKTVGSDLARYAETGDVSDAKRRRLRRQAARA